MIHAVPEETLMQLKANWRYFLQSDSNHLHAVFNFSVDKLQMEICIRFYRHSILQFAAHFLFYSSVKYSLMYWKKYIYLKTTRSFYPNDLA